MNHEYAVWLAERPGCQPELKLQLLEHFGSAEAVWNATEKELMHFPGVQKKQREALLQKGLEHARIILRDCARQDIRVLSIEESGYPTPLRDLVDAPTVLYVRGTLPEWEHTIAIGIVGTRRATSYGLRASRWLSSNLAHAGCVIVSGMALGIDGEANRGAIQANGTTIAVLGCGVDVCYPSAHKKLMEDIIAHGAILSEYPPGTEPRPYHFPQRNRIMSGLSRGIVVIEAPAKSGALITADRALEQGRDVFAVPGNINSPQSMGSNQLLREGAELVTCAADVLAHYPEERLTLTPTEALTPTQPPETDPVSEQPPRTAQDEAMPRQTARPPAAVRISLREQEVLEAVQDGADSADAIIEATGLAAARVQACLTMLEIHGVIRRDGARVLLLQE